MGATVAAAAAVVAAIFTVALLRRWRARGRTNTALVHWSISLGMFAVASGALAYGEAVGWTSAWFRLFYLFGGVLVVPWLAMGTVQTSARDRTGLRILGAAAVIVGAAFVVPLLVSETPLRFLPAVVLSAAWGALLLTAPRDGAAAGSLALVATFSVVAVFAVSAGQLQAELPTQGLPEGNELFAPGIRGLALAGNGPGATLVVVGAAAAAWRLRGRGAPHLVLGNLLIGLGVLIAASGGVFAYVGETASHAIAFAVGVTVMYAGFTRTTRVPGQVPQALDEHDRRVA